MLAGALQAAIYNSMDGRNGISGWRWMFVSSLLPLSPHQLSPPPFPLLADSWDLDITDYRRNCHSPRKLCRAHTDPRFPFETKVRLSLPLYRLPSAHRLLLILPTVPGHSISAHPISPLPALGPPNSIVPITRNSRSHLWRKPWQGRCFTALWYFMWLLSWARGDIIVRLSSFGFFSPHTPLFLQLNIYRC